MSLGRQSPAEDLNECPSLVSGSAVVVIQLQDRQGVLTALPPVMHPLPTQSHPRQSCICHHHRVTSPPHFPSSAQASPLSLRLPCQLDISLPLASHSTSNSKSNLITSSNLFLLPGAASQLKAPSIPDSSSCLTLAIQPQGVSMAQQQGCHLEAHLRCKYQAHPRPSNGSLHFNKMPR